jgi:pectinesterase
MNPSLRLLSLLSLVLALTSLSWGAEIRPQWEKTVAQDGSGDYKTVLEAILAVPTGSPESPCIIRVKPGVYVERLYIQREKRYLRLIGLGESAADTVIAFRLHANVIGEDGLKIGTFRTPTLTVDADDFDAENITISNTAGPIGQALALRVDGDRASFNHCRFLGWQDTIFINRGRQFFYDCSIEGHVDFIFGGATAYFERCEIRCLRDGYVTAASTPQEQPFGYVFHKCRIVGATPEVRTYLGRPWRLYAATLFIDTEMDQVVRPVGWHDWGKAEAHKTARYGEFGSTGAGASQSARPDWALRIDAAEAAGLTPAKVLAGADSWNPLNDEWRKVQSKQRQ